MAAAAILDRLDQSSKHAAARGSERLWARILLADLELVNVADDAELLIASVPHLVDALAVGDGDVLQAALTLTARAVESVAGVEAFSRTVWGARRAIKLAGRLDLDDETRRLVDRLLAVSSEGSEGAGSQPGGGGLAAEALGGSVSFEAVHREDMYPPSQLEFRVVPASKMEPARLDCSTVDRMAAREVAQILGRPRPCACAACVSTRRGEDAPLALCMLNPSRRERFGSEIPSKIWPASVILAQLLWNHPELVRSRRVLELGAGMGLAGLAAMRCSPRWVVMTDIDTKVIGHMRSNISANAIAGETTAAHAAYLDWADLPTLAAAVSDDNPSGERSCDEEGAEWRLRQPADLILAADVVNADGLSELVYAAVLHHLARTPESLFVMVCPRPEHRHSVEKLRELLTRADAELECAVGPVPSWLLEASRSAARGAATDIDESEFDVLQYELYIVRRLGQSSADCSTSMTD